MQYIWNWICNRFRRMFLPMLLRRSGRIFPRRLALNVRRPTKGVVIKELSSKYIDLEVEALNFVSTNTTIPVPKVYDVQSIGNTGKQRLFMQFMDGETLARKWATLTSGQKRTVMRQLGEFVQQLRNLQQPSPRGWIGSVSGKPFIDMRLCPQDPVGPFKDEQAYNDWRISTFHRFAQSDEAIAQELQALRQRMRNDHRIFFTHGDISRHNVLVKVTGNGDHDIQVTSLLDWEQAGWRPEFWEAAKIVYATGSEHEWGRLSLELVVPGYEKEVDLEDDLLLISGPPR